MTYQYILDIFDDGLMRKGKALDLGCGSGQASVLLASLGFRVDAVDKADQLISITPGNITFTKADIRDFNIEKDKYNFINARNVLHFLSKDEMKQTVGKMFDGLKKGGVMYFNVSGDKDGWVEKSKGVVTFLSESELVEYVESGLVMPVYNKVIRLGYGTTMKGVLKYTHTVAYTVIK